MEQPIRIVRLIDPSMCRDCRFGGISTTEMSDGSTRQGNHCSRYWCDNHQEEVMEVMPIRIINLVRY